MLELADKNFKAITVNMFKNSKVTMTIMIEQMGNSDREMEVLRNK